MCERIKLHDAEIRDCTSIYLLTYHMWIIELYGNFLENHNQFETAWSNQMISQALQRADVLRPHKILIYQVYSVVV